MGKLIQTLNSIIDEINKNENLEIIRCSDHLSDVSDDDLDFLIQNVEMLLGTKLPIKYHDYILPDGFDCCWNYKSNGELNTGGEITIRNVIAHYTNRLNTSFANELTSYEKEIYSKGYRPFDSHPYAGDGVVIALQIENGNLLDQVWYVDLTKEEMWPMNIAYPEYMYHSFYLKGLYDWHYLFSDFMFYDLDFDMTSLRKRLEDYPKLFPGADVSEYLKRYHDRGGI